MAAPIRDPYVVLGVGPAASDEQVHAAYRRLVRLHHPDHNPGDPDAARRFEEIQDAYARVRQLRGAQPVGSHPPPSTDGDPELEVRLRKLERELRKAQTARERARRAAAEARAQSPNRPSDEDLGYYKTDDSFARILADAQSELSSWLDQAQQHSTRRGAGDQAPGRRARERTARLRVAELLDELAAKVRGDGERDPGA